MIRASLSTELFRALPAPRVATYKATTSFARLRSRLVRTDALELIAPPFDDDARTRDAAPKRPRKPSIATLLKRAEKNSPTSRSPD
jgi:hypothetical protein